MHGVWVVYAEVCRTAIPRDRGLVVPEELTV